MRTKRRHFLPRTLLGRSMLILIAPMILTQGFGIIWFYERHWDSITRNMSSTLAGEIRYLLREYESRDEKGRQQLIKRAKLMGIQMQLDTSGQTVFSAPDNLSGYRAVYNILSERFDYPILVQSVKAEKGLRIAVGLPEGVLNFYTGQKRLVSSTTTLFLFWNIGTGVLLLIIAMIFLRNQIRPIRQLAQAAEKFGMGQEASDFHPRGASEIRQAGRAFLLMRNRVQRQVNTRTEMLAGISHDLRTPLTRLKLQMEMLELPETARAAMQNDVQDMQHMIQEYLDFAKGAGQEANSQVILSSYLTELVESYQRHQQPVTLLAADAGACVLRPQAMRRALQNIIDNAIYYGKQAELLARRDGAYWLISVRDHGPGIPEPQQEEVFRPFRRLDHSRNLERGAVGLGLSISRDVVLSHGGTIELRNRKKKGLEVLITLPVNEIEL